VSVAKYLYGISKTTTGKAQEQTQDMHDLYMLIYVAIAVGIFQPVAVCLSLS